MSQPTRPLIDRRRTSSRDRGVLHSSSRTSSPRHSPAPSPVGSPTHQAGQHMLRSALKHNHVHPEPRAFDEADFNPEAPCQPPAIEVQPATGGSSLPDSGLGPSTSTSGTSLGPQYSRRVGFDTFESGADLEEKGASTGGGTGVNYSFTISAKSSCFIRTRASRTYLVATDLNEYSVHALNWVLDSITEDHDEIVILRVIDPGSSAHSVWKAGARGMEDAREEAEGVLEQVMQKNGEEKQISIIVEFAIGPVEETIHRMIEIYRPDSLIVGTRGKTESMFKLGKGAYMGSISKWSVARSPVPVIVVRPSDKVLESLEHRRQDPKKRSYVSLLGSSANNSTTLLGLPGGKGGALERVTTAPEGGRRSEEKPFVKESSRSKWFGGSSEKKDKKGKEMKKFDTIS